MTDKVSIIVPVYNTSQYLRKCIDSLLNQTYKNIEVILINDGSTDDSLAICKEYSIVDARIFLIDKPNEGVEIARQTGYNHATGAWITYVDSDDYIPLNAIELMISKTAEDIDVVQGSKYRIVGKNGFLKKAFYMEERILEHDILMERYYKSFFGDRVIPVDMWAKLYRKEMLDQINIIRTGLRYGEDLCYNMQVFPHIRKLAMTSEIVYCYRWGGMTERMNESLFAEARKAYGFKCEMLKKYNVKDGLWNISNELKGFFIIYLESYILHTKLPKAEIVKISLLEWKMKENLWAIEVLKSEEKYLDDETRLYLAGKIEELYDMISKRIFKKKIRCGMLNIINRL